MNKLNIFVASGSELKEEREQSIYVIHELRKVFPSLNLEIIEWETDLPYCSYNGKTIQQEIDPLLVKSEVVLVLLYSKVGKFTLQEYHLALQKNKKIFLYFKTGFSPINKEETKKYSEVMDFKEEVEKENKMLYRDYDTLEQFKNFLYKDLNLYLSKGKPVYEKLFRGSEDYYCALRSPNGRFRFLNISEIILPRSEHYWIETRVEMNKSVFVGQRGDSLEKSSPGIINALPCLWNNKVPHAVIVGDGGMGKTVSLIHLWEKFLKLGESESITQRATNKEPERRPKESSIPGGPPLPVFIALNELNQVPCGKREGFILEMIRKYYGQNEVSTEEIEAIMKTPLKDGDKFIPSMVLLLDGFNEITCENRELLIELNRMAEHCLGIQVIITSRYDMRGDFNWGHWNLVKLQELDNDKVKEYLQAMGMVAPGQERLLTLLKNPMMLTLYAAACEVKKKLTGSTYCCFKEVVETPGELLWNFIEAQVGNLPERLGHDVGQIYYYKFLLKFFLPALGFEMEKGGLFDFTVEQMDECIDRMCRHFGQAGFLDTFREFEGHLDTLPIGDIANDINRRKRRAELKKVLSDGLHMMVKEGNAYRFLHQNFRDFFAAVYILNEMMIGLQRNEIPEVLSGGAISYYLQHYIGEIEGFHHQEFQPSLVEGEGWKLNENKDSLLYKSLDKCRGIFDDTVGFAVWNIVEILKDFRGGLSGTDLSNLDLSKILFQGVKCGLFFKNKYLGTLFDGSLITEESFLPERDIGGIKGLALSNDGKRFLASSLKLVVEWEIETGRCLMKFSGHSKTVNSVSYSPDEQKVLTASADSTIKEWDRVSGECLRTFEGHSQEVKKAIYSDDGKKILSASRDETIREWDSETGECQKVFIGHSFEVIGAKYAGNGKMIISRSSDKKFRIWDRAAEKCLFTSPVFPERLGEVFFDEKENQIVGAIRSDKENLFKINWAAKTLKLFDISNFFCIDFHLKSRKFAAGYYGGYIKEWNLETGNCLKTMRGQSATIDSIKYSEGGSRIISGNNAGTIEYWDVGNEQLLKTYIGRIIMINGAVFSNDGRKLLIASADGLIKEWNLDQGKFTKFFFGHLGSVSSAVYSPDGKRMLSASNDNTIKEWDLETGKCLKTFLGHTNSVNSAVYSADGIKVLSASSDKTIREWDWKTGKCNNVFNGHSSAVNSAVYSSNGMKILSTSCEFDYLIKEWDIKTGDCLKIYRGHKHFVQKAHYIDDDRKILSMALDMTLKEWCVKDEKCLKSSEIGEFNYYYPFVEEIPPGIKINPISPYQVEVLETSSNFCHRIENVPLLNVLGCSFKNLHPESRLTEKFKNLLENHGGTF